jgi:hypothetical protein
MRRHLRHHVRGMARVRTLSGSAWCEVVDVALGGVLLASTHQIMRHSARVCVELQLHGLPPLVELGTLVRRNSAASVIMFDMISPALQDAIATLGWLVQDERAHPRVLVAASVPTCAAISRELERRGAVALDAHTPLEALRRLEEPVTDAAGALIASGLTQTSGDELASYVEIAYPATRIAMLDEDVELNPFKVRRTVAAVLGSYSGPVQNVRR